MADNNEVKSILVLGAGLVARPAVRYLLDRPAFRVTIASRTVSKAEALIQGHERGTALALNVRDLAALEALVASHDLTLSLLPATMHVEVARLCLKHGRLMATTSYISPAMRELDGPAREKGLLFLNECGVDPGIDHMSAMRIFDDVWKRGGKIVSFKSYCGGLPAPADNNNPLGYKFSWAPRGVLVAAGNNARYLWEGETVDVPGPMLLTAVHLLDVEGAGTFEAYPNRDSLAYLDTYGLQNVQTMYRGTLRNVGHCARWKAWTDLGLFSQQQQEFTERTLVGVLRQVMGLNPQQDPRQAVAERLGLAQDADPITALAWLGFFTAEALHDDVETPVDALAQAMLARMQYAPGERDMIAMHHEVIAEFPDHRERTIMDLVDFGIPGGDSSMARTVSLPVAIGIRMMLEGQINEVGVHAPVLPAFYEPMLAELESLDIICRETTEIID